MRLSLVTFGFLLLLLLIGIASLSAGNAGQSDLLTGALARTLFFLVVWWLAGAAGREGRPRG